MRSCFIAPFIAGTAEATIRANCPVVVTAPPHNGSGDFSATLLSSPYSVNEVSQAHARQPHLPLARRSVPGACPCAYPGVNPPTEKLNPLYASSNCRLLTPKSANRPSSDAGCTCFATFAERLAHQSHTGSLAAHFVQNPRQPNLGKAERLGVAIEADQVALGSQLPKNAFGVARQPEVQSR